MSTKIEVLKRIEQRLVKELVIAESEPILRLSQEELDLLAVSTETAYDDKESTLLEIKFLEEEIAEIQRFIISLSKGE